MCSQQSKKYSKEMAFNFYKIFNSWVDFAYLTGNKLYKKL